MHFGVFRAQGTCLVAVNVFLSTGSANSALPNPLAGFEGPLGAGKREGKGRRGGRKKERDERDGINIPLNKFLVTALKLADNCIVGPSRRRVQYVWLIFGSTCSSERVKTENQRSCCPVGIHVELPTALTGSQRIATLRRDCDDKVALRGRQRYTHLGCR